MVDMNKASAQSPAALRAVTDAVPDQKRKISGVRLKVNVDESNVQVPQIRVHCFPNDPGRIALFVGELLMFLPISSTDAEALTLSLRELLLNAMEHGNLGLSFQDKANALAAGTWKQTIAARAKREPYRRRSTRVKIYWTQDRVAFVIADEGDGFNWRALLDPTGPTNVLRDNGRGIGMARSSVDSLHFNERGNEVTIIKHLG